MQRILILIICTNCSFWMLGQQQSESSSKVNGAYAGLTVGTEFQNLVIGTDVQLVFRDSWGVQGGITWFKDDAKNLPNDYYNGSFGLLNDEVPSDYITLITFLASKRKEMTKNFGLSFMAGPNFMYEKLTVFEFRQNSTIDQSNYDTRYKGYYGFGFTGRVGVYWVVSKWCGFQLDMIGNLNERRNYAAVCLTLNVGRMGKEE